MWRNQLFVGGLVSVLALATQQPLDAQEPRAGAEVRREAQAGAARHARRASEILGSKVYIQGDLAVGKVEDIVFSEDGVIEYLVVLNDDKYVLVPWAAARPDFGRRTVVTDITRERFREVPTFTRSDWPNVYDTQYTERVYKPYGIKPGRGRGAERIENREGGRKR